jgi:hypothetical protein
MSDWVGQRMPGISADHPDALLDFQRQRGVPGRRVDGSQLVQMGIEVGSSWDILGVPESVERMTLRDRDGTDAELLYLQLPMRIPFGMYVHLFGGSLPTLLFTDFGHDLQPGAPKGYGSHYQKRDQMKIDFWKAANACGPSTKELETIQEPTSLILSGKGFDGVEFSWRITSNQIVSPFTDMSRAIVACPQFKADERLGHRIMSGLGIAQVVYFHSLLLFGMLSGNSYDPALLVYNEMKTSTSLGR